VPPYGGLNAKPRSTNVVIHSATESEIAGETPEAAQRIRPSCLEKRRSRGTGSRRRAVTLARDRYTLSRLGAKSQFMRAIRWTYSGKKERKGHGKPGLPFLLENVSRYGVLKRSNHIC
jgi:hypothetical protein